MSWNWKDWGGAISGGWTLGKNMLAGDNFGEALSKAGKTGKFFKGKEGLMVEAAGDLTSLLKAGLSEEGIDDEKKRKLLKSGSAAISNIYVDKFIKSLGLDNWLGEQTAREISEYIAQYLQKFVGPMFGIGPKLTPEQQIAAKAELEQKTATKIEKTMIEKGVANPELAAHMQDQNMLVTMTPQQAKDAYLEMAVGGYNATAKDAKGNFINLDAEGNLITKEQRCSQAEAQWNKDHPNPTSETFQRVATLEEYLKATKRDGLSQDEVAADKEIKTARYNKNLSDAVNAKLTANGIGTSNAGHSVSYTVPQVGGSAGAGTSLNISPKDKEKINSVVGEIEKFNVNDATDGVDVGRITVANLPDAIGDKLNDYIDGVETICDNPLVPAHVIPEYNISNEAALVGV